MRKAALTVVILTSLLLPLSGTAAVQVSPAGETPRLVVLDRNGKVVNPVTEPGTYNQPVFSSDRQRIAAVKPDPRTQTADIWVIELPTGRSTQVTFGASNATPVWSPDDSQIAYVSTREGESRIYRKASSGDGNEELLYRHIGFGGLVLTEWQPTNNLLRFIDAINISGAFYELPLDGTGKANEILRPTFYPIGAHISPDGRFIAYLYNESGRYDVYVRPFHPSLASGQPESQKPVRISLNGGRGMITWGVHSTKIYYLSNELDVMQVDLDVGRTVRARRPKRLFRAPSAILTPGAAGSNALATVSSDGERFAFALPAPAPPRQLTLIDAQGMVRRTIGAPGPYYQPSLSPDGRRVAVIHYDTATGYQDIWTLDVTTGDRSVVTADAWTDSAPIWSPDGNRIAFVSNRGDRIGIFAKQWNGVGREELLYELPRGIGGMVLTDWSADGRFLMFYAGDVLYVSPVDGRGDATEVVRSEFSAVGGRFSPDGRFVAYLSNESGKYEVHIQPIAGIDGRASNGVGPGQVSHGGAQGMIFWREDGRGIGYITSNGTVVTHELNRSDTIPGAPKPLFPQTGSVAGAAYNALQNPPQLKSVSRDNQRFVFAIPTQKNN